MNKTINHQQGIAQLAIVILLVAGILAGTILIQQGVNFLPHAEGTVACDGQTLSSQSAETQGAFRTAYPDSAETEWVTQHEQELADKGTPCGSGKQEGESCTLSSSDSISSACANEIDSKNPGFVATIEGSNKNTCTRAQIISNWCASNQADCSAKKQGAVACGGSGSGAGTGTGAGSGASCPVPADPKLSVDETYKQAKVAGNLVRFCAILNGVAEYCTPADLGVEPQKNADAKDGGSGRLLLCSGKDSKPNDLDIVWNVIVGNSIKVSSKPYDGSLITEINLREAVTAVGLNPDEFNCK